MSVRVKVWVVLVMPSKTRRVTGWVTTLVSGAVPERVAVPLPVVVRVSQAGRSVAVMVSD